MTIDRRDFLKIAGVQAGTLLALPQHGEAKSSAALVSGEYVAKRVLGKPTDAKLDAEFKIPEETYHPQPSDFMRARRVGITDLEELL